VRSRSDGDRVQPERQQHRFFGELRVDRLRDVALDAILEVGRRADGCERVAEGLEKIDLRDEVRLTESLPFA